MDAFVPVWIPALVVAPRNERGIVGGRCGDAFEGKSEGGEVVEDGDVSVAFP
jgi:hypothetical protein